MKPNILNILDHKILKKKNNILQKALKNEKDEDKIIKTISSEIIKMIIRFNKIRKG